MKPFEHDDGHGEICETDPCETCTEIHALARSLTRGDLYRPEIVKLVKAIPAFHDALVAMRRARETAIVDDDFTELIHRADLLMDAAFKKSGLR